MSVTPPRHVSPAERAGQHAAMTRRERREQQERSSRGTKPRRSVASRLIGGFGEILITLGVLGLLFVVWELWWTGIEADQDRRQAIDDFYTDFPGIQAAPDSSTGEDEGGEPEYHPIDFETCYELEDGTEIACAHSMRERADGADTMAMLYSPRLGDEWAAPVREGVAAAQLDRGGVGRYPNTQMPDELGNFAVAGHRNTYASMLGNQDALETGDNLYLVTPGEGVYVYEVIERHVVTPQSIEVLNPVPSQAGVEPEVGLLTLTTCHPLYSNAERLIHHAEIVDFIPHGAEMPSEIQHHLPEPEDVVAGGVH